MVESPMSITLDKLLLRCSLNLLSKKLYFAYWEAQVYILCPWLKKKQDIMEIQQITSLADRSRNFKYLPCPITSWQIDGETVEKVADFIFWDSKITSDGDCSHEIKRLAPWKKSYDQRRQHIKKQRHYFANKGPSSQSYGFSSSHVWMLELDYKESWAPKNWCFWTVVFEKTLESPLDCKEIQLVHPKGNKSWIFIGMTDAEAETLILGHLMRRTDSLEKTLMLGMIEGGRRRGWQWG